MNEERWLVSIADNNQVIRNVVLEEDPINWLMRQRMQDQEVVLISCFQLTIGDNDFYSLKQLINQGDNYVQKFSKN